MAPISFYVNKGNTLVTVGSIIEVKVPGYEPNGFYQVTKIIVERDFPICVVNPISTIASPDGTYCEGDLDYFYEQNGITIYNS